MRLKQSKGNITKDYFILLVRGMVALYRSHNNNVHICRTLIVDAPDIDCLLSENTAMDLFSIVNCI